MSQGLGRVGPEVCTYAFTLVKESLGYALAPRVLPELGRVVDCNIDTTVGVVYSVVLACINSAGFASETHTDVYIS